MRHSQLKTGKTRNPEQSVVPTPNRPARVAGSKVIGFALFHPRHSWCVVICFVLSETSKRAQGILAHSSLLLLVLSFWARPVISTDWP